LSFTARHEAGHGDAAVAVLGALEAHRTRLEALFPNAPGNVTVVLHDSAIQLALAQPYLPLARRFAAPAGRRYMAGWFGRAELHVLAPDALRKRAGGRGSLEALMLTPERTYAQLVVGTNNAALPPPFRPGAFARLLRCAWLSEGAAQYFSGQVPHLRSALSRRLRDGPVPFPPGTRDAPLLAGALFDLLGRERGEGACVALACDADAGDSRRALQAAFQSDIGDVAYRWRRHLELLASEPPSGVQGPDQPGDAGDEDERDGHAHQESSRGRRS
jgi:hypothetical protein